jgi:ABC-type sulfate/molybdate transport systems ATPase subunit
MTCKVGELAPASLLKVRLARALAFAPDVLLVEHPTAGLPRGDVAGLARQVRSVAEGRGVACLTLTADREFAGHVASRVLTLEPGTGRLRTSGRGWFARRR